MRTRLTNNQVEALGRVIDYLWKDEKENLIERGREKHDDPHIFHDLLSLSAVFMPGGGWHQEKKNLFSVNTLERFYPTETKWQEAENCLWKAINNCRK